MSFESGSAKDGKHYWLVPPELYAKLNQRFSFTFDPCPYPKPDDFDGLTAEWGSSNWVNPPFGVIMHEGKKKDLTAWARKCIEQAAQEAERWRSSISSRQWEVIARGIRALKGTTT